DRAGGAVEQARPDRGAQRDEMQMACLQTGPATGRRGGGGGLRARAHRGVTLREAVTRALLVPLTRYGGWGGRSRPLREPHTGARGRTERSKCRPGLDVLRLSGSTRSDPTP